jgi:hypothetical protein
MHRSRPHLAALTFCTRAAWVALCCTLAACGSFGAQAQSYPNRPVRMIVPLAPGGSMDTIARTLAHKLTEATGQNFIVDNRPGAGSSIGLETAANSPEKFRQHMLAERAQWTKIIKQAGISGK